MPSFRNFALLLLSVPAAAQTLTIDTPSAPYHTVVHLTATAPAGTPVTFFDSATPLATITTAVNGLAVLGTATLAPGVHTLTAGSSAPVTVTITRLPAPFTFTVDQQTAFQQSQLAFALQSVNPLATGTLTYTDNGVTVGVDNLIPIPPTPTYRAFGDSITSGYTLTNPSLRYPDLFAGALGFTNYLNYADASALTCDQLTHYILPSQASPTQTFNPLYTLMTGSGDAIAQGSPKGEPNFTTCHLATLAWLGIPREYKVLPGDPALTYSGPWSLPPATPANPYDSTDATLYNSSGTGSAQFAVTSNGGPLYLWYLLSDHIAGNFTVSMDGTPTGVTYSSSPPTPISSLTNRPFNDGFALLRFPVTPGAHTLRVDILAGTVGLLAAATPPSPGPASTHPTVFSTDIPNQSLTQGTAPPGTTLQFTMDAAADLNLLLADGLDLRPVNTRATLTGTPTQFNDFAHPSVLGHQILAAALESAYGTTSTTPFLTNGTAVPRHYLTAGTPGPHTFTVQYSGDLHYQPLTASLNVTVVPTGHSLTTLALPATTFFAAQNVTATATIFPPNPGGGVAVLESGQVLAFTNVQSNTGAFSFLLPAGLHTLYAGYSGDGTNAASTSPPISIQILKNAATMTLSGAPAELSAYNPLTLSATLQPSTATGPVTFTDTFTPAGQANAQSTPTVSTLGKAGLAGGIATFTTQALPPGTHAITAAYAGDANNNPIAAATPSITIVDLIPTFTTLSAATAPRGQPSTVTATVFPAGLTGALSFTDQTTGMTAQQTLTNGTATWTSSTFTTGPHTLTAAYLGDATHAASTSSPLVAIIPQAPSAVTLSTPAPTVLSGLPVTFTAALTPAGTTGTITFSDPVAGTLGQAVVTAAAATLTLPALPVAAYSVTATYSGDTNYKPSSSSPVALRIFSNDTTTTLTAPSTAPYATPVTFTVSVAPTPSAGLIRFVENGTLLGTAALQNGIATFITASLAPGFHTLSATFPGDGTINPSTGAATITITPAASATSLTLAQSTVLAGSAVTVNLRVTTAAATPTGTITLRSGTVPLASGPVTNAVAGAAYATLSFPTSTAGTFPLTAAYSGDPGTAASGFTGSYTVLPRIASGTLTLSATQVPPQTPVTLIAAFTSPATSGPALIPTGSVTFSNGTTALATIPLDFTGQATFTLPAQLIGAYILTSVYTPTGVFTASAIPSQHLLVTTPLAVSFITPALVMSPGTSADATAAITPLSGFHGALSTQCTTDATFLTCTVDAPTTLTTTANATIHLALAHDSSIMRTGMLAALLLPLVFIRRRRFASLLTPLLIAILTTGCAQGGNFTEVPPGTHYLTLTTTAAGTPTTTTLAITIQ